MNRLLKVIAYAHLKHSCVNDGLNKEKVTGLKSRDQSHGTRVTGPESRDQVAQAKRYEESAGHD